MEYAIRSIAISLFVREELGIDLSQRYRIKPISKSPRRFEFTEISEEEREYYDQKTKTEPRVVNGGSLTTAINRRKVQATLQVPKKDTLEPRGVQPEVQSPPSIASSLFPQTR